MFKQSFMKTHGKPLGRPQTVELPTNRNDTMEDFVMETKKGMWHVFNYLDKTNDDSVPTSQLKVITANVGMKLGYDKAEQFLEKEGLTNLGFASYLSIVNENILEKLGSEMENGSSCYGELLNEVLFVCWTYCSFKSSHESKTTLSSEHGLKLWRLFNFLCEMKDISSPVLPMVIHKEEAGFILREFISTTGQKSSEQAVKQIVDGNTEFYSFVDFLSLFEKDFIQTLTENDITLGLNQLYEMVFLDVLKKGMMVKRGHNVKNWKDRWLVLIPKCLTYYANQSQKQLKGTIVFDIDCRIELLPDRPGHKPNRFVLQTTKKPYEMSAQDLKSKNEWVSAFQLAIDNAGSGMHMQKSEAKKRREARADVRLLAEDEAKKRQDETELLRQRQDELDVERKKRLEDEALLLTRLGQLEEERKRRADAEARFQEEQLLREAEQQRLRELEAIKQELERLLMEERQAKKDEEIVRALQAKILEEEFQRREELEKLKQEQDVMLLAEREQKAVLESDREEQRRRLQEAQERLEQLERDRQAADEKLQEAADKLSKAEKDRVILEEKAKLWRKPVGLAKPVTPIVNPNVTHRGEGAFCHSDFQKGIAIPSRDPEDFFLRKLRERAEKSKDIESPLATSTTESASTDPDAGRSPSSDKAEEMESSQNKSTDDAPFTDLLQAKENPEESNVPQELTSISDQEGHLSMESNTTETVPSDQVTPQQTKATDMSEKSNLTQDSSNNSTEAADIPEVLCADPVTPITDVVQQTENQDDCDATLAEQNTEDDSEEQSINQVDVENPGLADINSEDLKSVKSPPISESEEKCE